MPENSLVSTLAHQHAVIAGADLVRGLAKDVGLMSAGVLIDGWLAGVRQGLADKVGARATYNMLQRCADAAKQQAQLGDQEVSARDRQQYFPRPRKRRMADSMLAAIYAATNGGQGAPVAPGEPQPAPPQSAEQEAAWRAEYAASAELQHEFAPLGGVDTYVSYQRGVAAHRARILGQAKPKPEDEIQWRVEFARSPALQAEFVDDAHYCVFKRAELRGRVRFVRSRKGRIGR